MPFKVLIHIHLRAYRSLACPCGAGTPAAVVVRRHRLQHHRIRADFCSAPDFDVARIVRPAPIITLHEFSDDDRPLVLPVPPRSRIAESTSSSNHRRFADDNTGGVVKHDPRPIFAARWISTERYGNLILQEDRQRPTPLIP